MSEWKRVKIKDVCEGVYDGPHATPPVSSKGGIYLGISNITPDGHFDLHDIKYISEDDMPKWTKRVVPQEGDIVFSYEATLNLYAIIPKGFYGCLGRRMALIRVDETKVSNTFLYYYFFSAEWRKTIAENTIIGATVDRIPIAKFPDFPVLLPPLNVQNKIANSLSRYDSLIENYQKQIKLLEEAAQRLYKEWFVDLRFPGHENTKIVDGVPEGWEKKMITEVFDFKYGKILPTKEFISDGPIPVYGASKQIGRYTKANCFEPKVLVGSRGNAGFVHRTIENETYVTNNSFIVDTLSQYDYLKLPFIFESFKLMDFVAICTGAAQPQLTLNSIASLKYFVPSRELVERYCEINMPIFENISMAYNQIRLLTEARDRLLPKLMGGEIKV